MKNKRIGQMVSVSAWIATWLTTTFSGNSMSAEQHYEGMMNIGGMNSKLARTVTIWMDQPATKPGAYINHKAGSVPLSPSNHGALRHNPENVASALSGNGQVNPIIRDAARSHKIEDIFHNKASVDGWKPTASRKEIAGRLIEFRNRNGRFPQRLPAWVDRSGPGIVGRNTANGKRFFPSATGEAQWNILGKNWSRTVGRAAPAIAIAIGAGIATYEAHTAHREFMEGLIEYEELLMREREAMFGATGGTVGVLLGGACGGAVTANPIGVIGGAIAGGAAGEKAGRWVAKTVYNDVEEKVWAIEIKHELFGDEIKLED
jgi:hypothetical protein